MVGHLEWGEELRSVIVNHPCTPCRVGPLNSHIRWLYGARSWSWSSLSCHLHTMWRPWAVLMMEDGLWLVGVCSSVDNLSGLMSIDHVNEPFYFTRPTCKHTLGSKRTIWLMWDWGLVYVAVVIEVVALQFLVTILYYVTEQTFGEKPSTCSRRELRNFLPNFNDATLLFTGILQAYANPAMGKFVNHASNITRSCLSTRESQKQVCFCFMPHLVCETLRGIRKLFAYSLLWNLPPLKFLCNLSPKTQKM